MFVVLNAKCVCAAAFCAGDDDDVVVLLGGRMNGRMNECWMCVSGWFREVSD